MNSLPVMAKQSPLSLSIVLQPGGSMFATKIRLCWNKPNKNGNPGAFYLPISYGKTLRVLIHLK